MPEDHNNKERPYRTFTSSGEHSGTLGAAGDYTRWNLLCQADKNQDLKRPREQAALSPAPAFFNQAKAPVGRARPQAGGSILQALGGKNTPQPQSTGNSPSSANAALEALSAKAQEKASASKTPLRAQNAFKDSGSSGSIMSVLSRKAPSQSELTRKALSRAPEGKGSSSGGTVLFMTARAESGSSSSLLRAVQARQAQQRQSYAEARPVQGGHLQFSREGASVSRNAARERIMQDAQDRAAALTHTSQVLRSHSFDYAAAHQGSSLMQQLQSAAQAAKPQPQVFAAPEPQERSAVLEALRKAPVSRALPDAGAPTPKPGSAQDSFFDAHRSEQSLMGQRLGPAAPAASAAQPQSQPSRMQKMRDSLSEARAAAVSKFTAHLRQNRPQGSYSSLFRSTGAAPAALNPGEPETLQDIFRRIESCR